MPDAETAARHLSSFDLDMLEMGALEEVKKKDAEDHLAVCAACRREHESLRKLRADFTSNVLPRTVVQVRERAHAPSSPTITRAQVWVPLLASAAALALWTAGKFPTHAGSAGDDSVVAKGRTDLQLVARHDGRIVPVDKTAHNLSPGDEIRFVVTSADPRVSYLIVASIDGAGHTNVYHPFGGAVSARIEHPGKWEVPGSIVLDESPGPERIFAFFSKDPLAATTVTQALSAVGQRGWDAIRSTEHVDVAGSEQTSFVIEKPAEKPAPRAP